MAEATRDTRSRDFGASTALGEDERCRSCGSVLPSGAHYCNECGTSADVVAVDLFHVEEQVLPVEAGRPPGRRRGLWALLIIVVAAAVILWALGFTVETPRDGPDSADAPTDAVPANPTSSTTTTTTPDPSTTAVPTTGGAASVTPTTAEEQYVAGSLGPVLGDGIDGMVVVVDGPDMRQIDLATGEITHIHLDHPIYAVGWGHPGENSAIIDGTHVQFFRNGLRLTRLSDGFQPEPVMVDADLPSDSSRLMGPADDDSVWMAKEPWPDGVAAAIEVSLDGMVRRQVDLPEMFWVIKAEGDELLLQSPDGTWRYDTTTSTAERMLGGLVDLQSGVPIMMSCDETLSCKLIVDLGDGPAAVDWPEPDDLENGGYYMLPDGRGLLLHDPGWGRPGPEPGSVSFIDLATGERTELGQFDIDPWAGMSWIGDTSWIVGQSEGPNPMIVAIDTRTADRVTMDLDRRGGAPGLLTYIPPS